MSKERRLRLCGCARLPAKYGDFRIRVGCMIRAHFLSPDDRADLIALARNGSAAHRLARRANALVLLDDGWSCENVARALLLDDDTIRGWHGLFVAEGLEGLARFEAGGSACQVSGEQQEKLKAWVAAAATPPRGSASPTIGSGWSLTRSTTRRWARPNSPRCYASIAARTS